MALRDELDRLIAEERAKLDAIDSREADKRNARQEKFRPLLQLLQQVACATDTAYLQFHGEDGGCRFDLGGFVNGVFNVEAVVSVQPDWTAKCTGVPLQFLTEDRPGFTIHMESRSYPYEEKWTTHESEQEVVEIVMREIAAQVAKQKRFERVCGRQAPTPGDERRE